MSRHMRAISAGVTDVGRERDINEDRFVLLPAVGVFVVADGMGGHNCGEVASRMATNMVSAFFREEKEQGGTGRTVEQLLATSLREANAKIHERAMNSVRYRGMGTTVVAAAFQQVERRMYIAHAGDSRCYRFRGGKLARLTRDHSLVEEALRSRPDMSETDLQHLPGNVITRALGVEPTVNVEVNSDGAEVGDVYLLCSDGLHGFVEEKRIEEILAQTDVLPTACGELVAEANASGGGDNITAVLVRVETSEDDSWISSTSAPPPPGPVVVKPVPEAMDIGADDTAKVTPLNDPEAILAALEKADREEE